MIIAMVCVAAALVATALLAAGKCRSSAPSKPTPQQRNADLAREREAFYMQNFWNYDGSEQEDFEE